jgi:hypothetical protein
MSPVTVSTTSPSGAEIFSPVARLPSSTTWGVDAFGVAALGVASSSPPQAATVSAVASATTISRMLRPTTTLPSGPPMNTPLSVSADRGRG